MDWLSYMDKTFYEYSSGFLKKIVSSWGKMKLQNISFVYLWIVRRGDGGWEGVPEEQDDSHSVNLPSC